jgi:hypothetical protein
VSSASSNPRHGQHEKFAGCPFLGKRAELVDDKLDGIVKMCCGLKAFRRLQQRVLVQARPCEMCDKLGPVDETADA